VIVVTGTFRLPLENRTAARQAMERVITASRAEPGCIAYSYAEDVLEPDLFRVSEAWESREALATHFETPHMIAWRRQREKLGMTDRNVTAYTVTDREEL
jgi:quinol monooxygenase YgiN